MAGFPSLPLFVKDYLVDTTALTLEQSGAYLHLLMHAWSRGGSLPDCDRQLAAFTKSTIKKWRGLRPAVEPYFTVENGAWTNARLSREWQYVREVSEKRASAGAMGGAARARNINDLPKQMLKPGLSPAVAPTLTPTLIEKRDTIVSPKGRGSRLPDDWQPDEVAVARAGLIDEIKALIPAEDRKGWTDGVVASFCDYWHSKTGAGATKLDWQMTFNNWLRKELGNVRQRNWTTARWQEARAR